MTCHIAMTCHKSKTKTHFVYYLVSLGVGIVVLRFWKYNTFFLAEKLQHCNMILVWRDYKCYHLNILSIILG